MGRGKEVCIYNMLCREVNVKSPKAETRICPPSTAWDVRPTFARKICKTSTTYREFGSSLRHDTRQGKMRGTSVKLITGQNQIKKKVYRQEFLLGYRRAIGRVALFFEQLVRTSLIDTRITTSPKSVQPRTIGVYHTNIKLKILILRKDYFVIMREKLRFMIVTSCQNDFHLFCIQVDKMNFTVSLIIRHVV
jgi:hypothetical protein